MRAFVVLLSIFWCSVGFASAKKVEVMFTYPKEATIKAASLWMDGVKVCTEEPISPIEGSVNDYSFVCDSLDIVAGGHNFTMTALVPTGETGPSSPEFPFYIELQIVGAFRETIK